MRYLVLILALLISFPVHAQVARGNAVKAIVSAADNNATNIKTSAATLYDVLACNNTASIKYVKFYNKASAPTCGTDTPYARVMLPASTCAPAFNSNEGLSFPTGLGYCIVTDAADSGNTAVGANEVYLNIGWR